MPDNLSDDGYLLLAIADDFLAKFGGGDDYDADDVYTWLVAEARKLTKPGSCPAGGEHEPLAAGDARDGGPVHCRKCQAPIVDRNRPRVLVDFDGVIHRYSRGWADGTVYDPPMDGAREALDAIEADGYEVVIFSTRRAEQIRGALAYWGFPDRRVTNVKEAAVAQIDDRAIRFTGWGTALAELRERYRVEKRPVP
jgi:phosphoglycolate phosphatase-like HAD superfamily hydrolase